MSYRNENGSTGRFVNGAFVAFTSQADADGPAQAKPAAAPRPAASLPEDFPERDLILGTPFTTLEAISAASDEELLAVDGIGPAKLKAIRAYRG